MSNTAELPDHEARFRYADPTTLGRIASHTEVSRPVPTQTIADSFERFTRAAYPEVSVASEQPSERPQLAEALHGFLVAAIEDRNNRQLMNPRSRQKPHQIKLFAPDRVTSNLKAFYETFQSSLTGQEGAGMAARRRHEVTRDRDIALSYHNAHPEIQMLWSIRQQVRAKDRQKMLVQAADELLAAYGHGQPKFMYPGSVI